MEQVYTPKKNYKVLVNCMTYNQSKYIEDALNGFAMQKTDFPFVCLVMDDASTDGEQEVIKAWMERECDMEKAKYVEIELSNIILVPHIHNANCTFVLYFLKRNLWKEQELKESLFTPWRERCEYEALCEGDDYWIDENKLQILYDFMTRHPEHSMCFHSFENLYPDGTRAIESRYTEDRVECSVEDMIRIGGGYAKINSMLYRRSMYGKGYSEWISNCPIGDAPMQLTLFEKGRVGYINRVMSCYRVSASNSWTCETRSSKAKMVRLYSSIRQMWITYDRWTGHKYMRYVYGRIVHNEYVLIKYIISSTLYGALHLVRVKFGGNA